MNTLGSLNPFLLDIYVPFSSLQGIREGYWKVARMPYRKGDVNMQTQVRHTSWTQAYIGFLKEKIS